MLSFAFVPRFLSVRVRPPDRERRKRIFSNDRGRKERTDLKPPDEKKKISIKTAVVFCPSLKTTFSKPSLMSPCAEIRSTFTDWTDRPADRRGDSEQPTSHNFLCSFNCRSGGGDEVCQPAEARRVRRSPHLSLSLSLPLLPLLLLPNPNGER